MHKPLVAEYGSGRSGCPDHCRGGRFATLLSDTPCSVLLTVPGCSVIRAGNYGAAVRRPAPLPGSQPDLSGLQAFPTQYEPAGKRRDGSMSREGSVQLRRALIDLRMGLWRSDPAARRYAQQLRASARRAA